MKHLRVDARDSVPTSEENVEPSGGTPKRATGERVDGPRVTETLN